MKKLFTLILTLFITSCNNENAHLFDGEENKTSTEKLSDLITSKSLDTIIGDGDCSVDPCEAELGDQIMYHLEVSNLGPSENTNVFMSDLCPAGSDYISHSTFSGTFNPTTGLWNIGTISVGEQADLFLACEIMTDAGIIENIVEAPIGDLEDPSDDGNDLEEITDIKELFCDLDISYTSITCPFGLYYHDETALGITVQGIYYPFNSPVIVSNSITGFINGIDYLNEINAILSSLGWPSIASVQSSTPFSIDDGISIITGVRLNRTPNPSCLATILIDFDENFLRDPFSCHY